MQNISRIGLALELAKLVLLTLEVIRLAVELLGSAINYLRGEDVLPASISASGSS